MDGLDASDRCYLSVGGLGHLVCVCVLLASSPSVCLMEVVIE